VATELTEPLLAVTQLEVQYDLRDRCVSALHDVTFDVARGEIVGIVGESGCGKSTLSAAIMGLLPPNGHIAGGAIRLGERDLLALDADELRDLRGRELAMIFQDPLTSLNPTFTIGTQLADAQRAHRGRERRVPRQELRRRAVKALVDVGIPDASERLERFPHEFSGGMRQRIMDATALLLEPALLIADEPTSSLDVTLEAQILLLLEQLRREHDTAILLVSHDLGVIAQVCDRIVVMYAGRQVEQGDVVSVFERPRHPYTQALLAAAPSRFRRGEMLASIPGRVPNLSALPGGCAFADRCPFVQDVCRTQHPRLIPAGDSLVRCHAYDSSSGYVEPARPLAVDA
jgi:peptide/nickel transport system ATP-binding protein